MEVHGVPSEDGQKEEVQHPTSVARASGPERQDPLRLFMQKVKGDFRTGCWEWTGYKKGGYGHFTSGGKTFMAHRWSWKYVAELDLPEEDLDHICANAACVRPGHLQPASRLLNIQLRDERKRYDIPEGYAFYGPTKHRSMAESVRAVEYGLPSVWNVQPDGFEEQIIEAQSDGKPNQPEG